MKVSLLVPTLGEREAEINRLFQSLENQEYKNFEVIVVSQANHDKVRRIIDKYKSLEIIHICLNKKGLSYARNRGLERCSGDIVVLSDDDCWYHKNSLKIIVEEFEKNPNLDVLLTQIYDYENNRLYKKYSNKRKRLRKYDLMSRSSIEISFKRTSCTCLFDERFGLGSMYPCTEEVDFLINNYSKSKNYYYVPEVTVYHSVKYNNNDKDKLIAKGAFYGKNFNIIILLLVIIRDLIIKKQNNYKYLLKGYRTIKSTRID
ncbi:MAG: hypothetical protein PWR01_122 [Clostridiales bacterium]|nr:hypothetical protein [Clostridiales bacterium]